MRFSLATSIAGLVLGMTLGAWAAMANPNVTAGGVGEPPNAY